MTPEELNYSIADPFNYYKDVNEHITIYIWINENNYWQGKVKYHDEFIYKKDIIYLQNVFNNLQKDLEKLNNEY